ncbi:hypothetical protein EGW08_018911 [Elysia chlorotica]|uniref:Uncharacterized protein n=1 Tax=Elysia chlorotica TaxID=188477 RepID=A0A433SVR8_ELYCH|nr:hypothetical protein EGW08_018911 [Elysia chlorotica]
MLLDMKQAEMIALEIEKINCRRAHRLRELRLELRIVKQESEHLNRDLERILCVQLESRKTEAKTLAAKKYQLEHGQLKSALHDSKQLEQVRSLFFPPTDNIKEEKKGREQEKKGREEEKKWRKEEWRDEGSDTDQEEDEHNIEEEKEFLSKVTNSADTMKHLRSRKGSYDAYKQDSIRKKLALLEETSQSPDFTTVVSVSKLVSKVASGWRLKDSRFSQIGVPTGRYGDLSISSASTSSYKSSTSSSSSSPREKRRKSLPGKGKGIPRAWASLQKIGENLERYVSNTALHEGNNVNDEEKVHLNTGHGQIPRQAQRQRTKLPSDWRSKLKRAKSDEIMKSKTDVKVEKQIEASVSDSQIKVMKEDQDQGDLKAVKKDTLQQTKDQSRESTSDDTSDTSDAPSSQSSEAGDSPGKVKKKNVLTSREKRAKKELQIKQNLTRGGHQSVKAPKHKSQADLAEKPGSKKDVKDGAGRSGRKTPPDSRGIKGNTPLDIKNVKGNTPLDRRSIKGNTAPDGRKISRQLENLKVSIKGNTPPYNRSIKGSIKGNTAPDSRRISRSSQGHEFRLVKAVSATWGSSAWGHSLICSHPALGDLVGRPPIMPRAHSCLVPEVASDQYSLDPHSFQMFRCVEQRPFIGSPFG